MKNKRKVESWPIKKIAADREKISFPEFQREKRLWPTERKQLLIDSIMSDIDIPKLYFNKTLENTYEVVDGQQRLWAIWDYLDGLFEYKAGNANVSFPKMTEDQRKWITDYPIDIVMLYEADEEYLRKLFLRLQLGLLLITGEKLHALQGKMKDTIFKELSKHKFIQATGMPSRRYAKETLCAQIVANIFSRGKVKVFSRTRYEDLEAFFYEYQAPRGKDLEFFDSQIERVRDVFNGLREAFGKDAGKLKNRSLILSVALLAEELANDDGEPPAKFVPFTLHLLDRMKAESKAGFNRKNRELYQFQGFLSSAPGERYQIERRHAKLLEFWESYKQTGKIKGD